MRTESSASELDQTNPGCLFQNSWCKVAIKRKHTRFFPSQQLLLLMSMISAKGALGWGIKRLFGAVVIDIRCPIRIGKSSERTDVRYLQVLLTGSCRRALATLSGREAG